MYSENTGKTEGLGYARTYLTAYVKTGSERRRRTAYAYAYAYGVWRMRMRIHMAVRRWRMRTYVRTYVRTHVRTYVCVGVCNPLFKCVRRMQRRMYGVREAYVRRTYSYDLLRFFPLLPYLCTFMSVVCSGASVTECAAWNEKNCSNSLFLLTCQSLATVAERHKNSLLRV